MGKVLVIGCGGVAIGGDSQMLPEQRGVRRRLCIASRTKSQSATH